MAEITGIIESIIFRNDENGYTVGRIETDDDYLAFTGNFESIREGDYLTLEGEMVHHKTYGDQFKCSRYRYSMPATEQAVFSYLSSGILPGIGEKTAQLLVETFGNQVLDIIEKEPRKLLQIRGIGEKTLQGIVEAYQSQQETRSTMLALQEYGISAASALKLYKTYHDRTVSIVLENPYRIMEDVQGFGFKRADQLAQKIGIEHNDARRIAAGLQSVLLECYRTGNVFMEEAELIEKTAKTLEISEEEASNQIEQSLMSGEIRSDVTPEGTTVFYPEKLYQAEDNAALAVARLSETQHPLEIDDLEARLSRIEQDMAIQLDPSQRQALREAAMSSLTVITGGPGTGKTTIINGILMLYETLGLKALLAAPTGRAAKRMSETTGHEAMTIHRLLEYDPVGGFSIDEDNPLMCDALIVDESSMIDIELFDALLRGLRPESRLIFVGDADQLPSVGPGNVLADLIRSGACQTVSLQQIHRQKEGSVISENASLINAGKIPEIDNQSDFMLVGRKSQESTLECILDVLCERMPKTFHYNPFSDIQVMAPFKKGLLGTENLNESIQARLNPPAPYKHEISHMERIFREGDKVMQIQNNYNLTWKDENGKEGEGVFNGDIGVITRITPEEVEVSFTDEKTAVYDKESLSQLTLAYCITVHKSQGSEFPAVIYALSGGYSPFLNRRLLYTGVTRAKKKLMAIGNKEVFHHMIRNNTDAKRTSMLAHRIQNYQELGI